MAEPWHIHTFLQLDGDQRCPTLTHEFIQTLQLALANGKRWAVLWTNMVKEGLESLHARIDGEREAQQLLLRPLVVCLEKSRMCQNKYTIRCVSKSEQLCTLSHVWPFGLRYLVYIIHFKLFHSLHFGYIGPFTERPVIVLVTV